MSQYPTVTYRDGQLVPNGPIELTEGETYVIIPANQQTLESPGFEDPVWDDPAAIKERLERIDAIEPLQMSDAEFAEWEAAREEVKRVTLAAVRKTMGLDP